MILAVFSFLTILIASLGLFGLSSFTVETRTKEIGVRKVLGAGIMEITAMIIKEFVLLILISIIIAFPVAYYMMKNWLQDYTYRTNLSVWIFILFGLGILILAILIVSLHTFRAGNANPVDSIQQE